jgi:hypothetical protein
MIMPDSATNEFDEKAKAPERVFILEIPRLVATNNTQSKIEIDWYVVKIPEININTYDQCCNEHDSIRNPIFQVKGRGESQEPGLYASYHNQIIFLGKILEQGVGSLDESKKATLIEKHGHLKHHAPASHINNPIKDEPRDESSP